MISLRVLSEGASGGNASFLQARFWAVFKGYFGWSSKAYEFTAEKASSGAVTKGRVRVMVRRLAGPLSFAYVPGGPTIEDEPTDPSALLGDLALALRPELPRHCLFLRFDCPWHEIEAVQPGTAIEGTGISRIRPGFGPPLRKAPVDVQPPDSVLLDLGATEGGLLASMKPKWRYNIRLAEKKEVVVTEKGSEGLEDFWRLYEETSMRDRIAIHPRSYYEKLFEVCSAETGKEGPDLRLWVASHEGEAIAAIITLFYGSDAVYLYGASSDSKRSLMPAYALQWTAIRAAKARGCARYDFYGIPPSDDPDHPMAGLFRFKTGFGGRVIHYSGSWDYPYSKLLYQLWRFAESARSWWFKVAMKKKPARQDGGGKSSRSSR